MKTVMLVGHITERNGPGHYLRNWLAKLPVRLIVLFHPMLDSDLGQSEIWEYLPGELPKFIGKSPKISGMFGQLIGDWWMTVKAIRNESKIDVFVGINNFDTIPAIFLRLSKIIYYSSDYADQRFTNPLLNNTYRLIEWIALLGSNLVVSNTNRAASRRVARGLSFNKSIVISNGTDFSLIPKVVKKPKYKFVFQGHLSYAHGVMDFLQVVHKLIQNKYLAKLIIFGTGPAQDEIVAFIKANKLQKWIFLGGHVPHEKLVDTMIRSCEVGIASYSNNEEWTYYCSPLKVKDYLACGLAVIISDVPEVAGDIDKLKMGKSYTTQEQLYLAMREMFNDTKLKLYQKNVKKYIKDFDWDTMFDQKLKKYI